MAEEDFSTRVLDNLFYDQDVKERKKDVKDTFPASTVNSQGTSCSAFPQIVEMAVPGGEKFLIVPHLFSFNRFDFI